VEHRKLVHVENTSHELEIKTPCLFLWPPGQEYEERKRGLEFFGKCVIWYVILSCKIGDDGMLALVFSSLLSG